MELGSVRNDKKKPEEVPKAGVPVRGTPGRRQPLHRGDGVTHRGNCLTHRGNSLTYRGDCVTYRVNGVTYRGNCRQDQTDETPVAVSRPWRCHWTSHSAKPCQRAPCPHQLGRGAAGLGRRRQIPEALLLNRPLPLLNVKFEDSISPSQKSIKIS